MKTPQGSRGRARRRGTTEVQTGAVAAAMATRVPGKGKRGAAPGDLSSAAANEDRLAANRRRAARVRTRDSWSADGSARRGRAL